MAKSTVCYTVWWKNMKNFANSAYCLLPTVILVILLGVTAFTAYCDFGDSFECDCIYCLLLTAYCDFGDIEWIS